MPFRPGPASVPPGRARPDSDGVFQHGGSNRHMDRGAFAGIGTGRIHASSFCRGAELPFDRKRQRAPLLLRCGIPSENREACRSQHGPVVTRQGSISRGRNPDRRKAEEYLPRLLSDTDRGVLLNVVLHSSEGHPMTKENAKGGRVVRQRTRAIHLAGPVLDDRADSSASSRDQSTRKRRLLDGPKEFRTVRVDRSKTSGDDD